MSGICGGLAWLKDCKILCYLTTVQSLFLNIQRKQQQQKNNIKIVRDIEGDVIFH